LPAMLPRPTLPAVLESDEVEVAPETRLEFDESATKIQMVPETKFDDDREPDLDDNLRVDAVTSSADRVLTSINLASQTSPQEPVQSGVFFSRPKSSGRNLNSGFVFEKAPQLVMNFSREKQQSAQIITNPKPVTQPSNHLSGKLRSLRLYATT
jgi:hypothetical protein